MAGNTTNSGREHGTALVPEPAQRRDTGMPAARRNARLPHDQGGSARTMNPGKMTGSACATSPGREHGTATPAGTGTAQEYRDAQLPAEISGCRTTGRHNGRRNLRQRTRYCHPCRNRHSAGIQGCPTARRNIRLPHDRAAECAHKPKLNTQC